ncbi:PREDICTED: pre-mRNA-splicing factor Slu7 [Nicrophorus vespilloides]|uniref:Pre-mRNA-splicing factor SLU7 n=1 Tax=Nicrophorus vespilloides TaxID=110193 RepID=A0ABM1MWA3_NICVS|nr:PREDICTED: pre-mRNA-splicing factor Slu7 [Nicrophorus vespilloides]
MASSSQSMPISQILKSKSDFEDEPKKKSREDWRKAKELEEARKAGTAPAAVDEEGKDINPHIPQYISSAPWYYGTSGPTLKHQRPQAEKIKEFSDLNEWYSRGVDNTKRAIKYRPGACENCGAMTHKKKDCFERPRNIGAKFSGKNIAADEFAQKHLSLDYDGKRDRWSGYDPSEHKSIIEEFQKVEEAKRQLRADKLNANEEEDDEDKDEDKYVDEVDMPGTKVDSKQRITVRNLRIREDTAKYLRNLDPNSAYYDPKTRSMRENPKPSVDDNYAGENFVRFSGDTTKHATAQLFAWEAYDKGVDVHLLAEPTKLEMLQKEYDKKKDQFKSQVHSDILERYGGEEHLQVPPKSLLLAQTEDYVEYSRSGKIIKGQEKEIIKSKYEEDVYINNHSSIWGSFWKAGHWGYKCCHSYIKNSYCLGDAGKNKPVNELPPPTIDAMPEEEEEVKQVEETKAASSSSSCSEDERTKTERKSKKKKNKKKMRKEKKKQEKEEDKLKKALQKEDEHHKDVEELMKLDERKRPYNSMFEVKKPSEEEVEAYYMKRRRDEDPMNEFV